MTTYKNEGEIRGNNMCCRKHIGVHTHPLNSSTFLERVVWYGYGYGIT